MAKMKTQDSKSNVVILYNTYKVWSDREREDANSFTQVMVDGLESLGHKVAICEFWKDVKPAIRKYKPSEWIVFNWCEGVEDEVGGDSRVCSELDELGYTYTGNSPWTLKLSVEKGRAKRMLERWNIPTPPGREFKTPNDVKEWTHFPSIVKPVSQHCSVAVTRDAVVHTVDQLKARIAYVNETVKEATLVEKFVAGREINVGVWGNGRPRMLPLREIDFSKIANPLHQMVTWDSKWVPDSPEWNAMPVIQQPVVSEALRARIEDVVMRTYRAFDCRDYARVDLRIDEHEQPFVVDVNPNPDICHDGGFAGGAAAAGFSYGEAISNIVGMAVARRNRKEALNRTLRTLKLRQRELQAVPV
jgi:D-alanine-D-alanine ligase